MARLQPEAEELDISAPQSSPLLSQVSSLIRQPTLLKSNNVVPLQPQSPDVTALPGLWRRGSLPSQTSLPQQDFSWTGPELPQRQAWAQLGSLDSPREESQFRSQLSREASGTSVDQRIFGGIASIPGHLDVPSSPRRAGPTSCLNVNLM